MMDTSMGVDVSLKRKWMNMVLKVLLMSWILNCVLPNIDIDYLRHHAGNRVT